MKKLVIFSIIFILFISVSVSAIDINECGVLDQEGEIYELVNNIETEDTCFRITADDITLDCNDHSITGPNNRRENYGAYNSGVRTTITNCDISGFQEGINLGFESQVINNNLYGNYLGISVVDRNTIRGNTITGSYDGVLIEGRLNIIIGNTITGNGNGINLDWGSQSNTITNNIITENYNGIRLDSSYYNTITNNHIENNGAGISLAGGYSNIITDNIINNNNHDGIDLAEGSSNIITDNIINNNNDYGIFLEDTNSNNITSNMFCYNEETDIRLNGGEDNEFLYNQFDTIEGLELEGMPCDIESQEIQLNQGWNLISSYLIPYFDEIDAIFGKLARQGILVIVKDENGNFYKPDFNFDNIHTWNSQEGYQVKVTEDTEITIKGEEHVNPIIQLHEGWNFMGYPLDNIMNMNNIIENILFPVIENIIIMKNDDGQFYAPEYNYNGIEEMIPGEGYMVKVREDVVIDFGIEE